MKKKITKDDIVNIELSVEQIAICAQNAAKLLPFIKDRKNLHERDPMERFNNVFMGEVAEQMVITYFQNQGKFAISAVNKESSNPDLGHDIYVISKEKREPVRISVKSSIDSCDIKTILTARRPAFTEKEKCQINIQVYFQLKLNKENKEDYRISVPSLKKANIISGFTEKMLGNKTVGLENRPCSDIFLENGLPVNHLVSFAADKGSCPEVEKEILKMLENVKTNKNKFKS